MVLKHEILNLYLCKKWQFFVLNIQTTFCLEHTYVHININITCKERSDAPKKFEDKEFEEILDEDRFQTLAELGKTLQVDESTVSKRLKVIGIIQKQGHWVPFELKPRDVERRFVTCELLL